MNPLPHLGAWLGAHWQLLLGILGVILSLTTIVANIYKTMSDRLTIKAKKQELKTEQKTDKYNIQAAQLKTFRTLLHAFPLSDASNLLLRIKTYECKRSFRILFFQKDESFDFPDCIFIISPQKMELPDDEPPPEPSPAPRRVRLATHNEVNRLPIHYSEQSLARYQKIIRDKALGRILDWLRTLIRRFVLQPAFQPA